MPSYLKRYVAGDYEDVWSELMALGEGVHLPPVLRDAEAVATETMRRVRDNVEMLISRLVGVVPLRLRLGAASMTCHCA